MRRLSPFSVRTLFFFAFGTGIFACGGKPPDSAATVAEGRTPIDVDGDPVALFPSGAFAAGEIDAKTFFAAGRSGAKLITIADVYNPIGDTFGVVASRDVDKVTFVAFAGASIELLGVARGHFDAEKFRDAAAKKLLVADGSPVIASRYREADLYTVANVGFTVLSPKTMLVGTEGGIRRAIDRLRDGASSVALESELLAAATHSAPFAIAFVAPPGSLASQALGSLPKPPVGGIVVDKLVGGRLTAGLEGDRTRVQALLATSSSEDGATVRDELQKLARMYVIAALVSPLPRLAEVHIEEGTNSPETPEAASLVRIDLAVDDGPLAKALGAVPLPRR